MLENCKNDLVVYYGKVIPMVINYIEEVSRKEKIEVTTLQYT